MNETPYGAEGGVGGGCASLRWIGETKTMEEGG